MRIDEMMNGSRVDAAKAACMRRRAQAGGFGVGGFGLGGLRADHRHGPICCGRARPSCVTRPIAAFGAIANFCGTKPMDDFSTISMGAWNARKSTRLLPHRGSFCGTKPMGHLAMISTTAAQNAILRAFVRPRRMVGLRSGYRRT